MARGFPAVIPLTIASGQTASSPITANQMHDAVGIMIYCPATLDALTFTLQVSHTKDGSGSWCTLVDTAGNPMLVPDASEARAYLELPLACSFRILASGAVAADRLFMMSKAFTL